MTEKIVVGVDDSAGARAALAWAGRQAEATGADLSVVHVFELNLAWIDAYDPEIPVWADRGREIAQRLLVRVVQEVLGERAAETVELEAVEGDPAQTLRAAALGADLLVVGCRGRGGFAGLLLGSVSQRVAQHPPCPVVVVPLPEDVKPD
jgi:nucleotide-binding universal stress UspA family protein